MEWVDKNSEETFGIEVGEFLANRSILIGDITEAKYLAKLKKTDDDSLAVVNLTLGSGVSLLPGATSAEDKLVIQFAASDFSPTGLNTDNRYYAGVAIKTATMTDWLEVILKDDDLIILDSFFVP